MELKYLSCREYAADEEVSWQQDNKGTKQCRQNKP